MRIPRVYVPDLPCEPGAAFTLEDYEASHLLRVLRVRVGAEVEAFDGKGRAARFVIRAKARHSVDLELIEPVEGGDVELPFRLTCAFAPPKGKRVRRLIEALTELGVTTLVPLRLERSEGKPPAGEQLVRWATEAAKQCRRNTLPSAHDATDLAALVALAADHAMCLLPDTTGATPLRDVIAVPPPDSVLFAVGPEGGFTPAERDALAESGFTPVALGRSVLRIETAACAVAAALIAAWG